LWADCFKPLTVNTPVLPISGNLDPVTPPQWGDEEHRLLPNGLHVVMPGAHMAQDDCVDKMSKALMDTGSLKTVDASCAEATKLPPWVLPNA
jgi:TAP-like protein